MEGSASNHSEPGDDLAFRAKVERLLALIRPAVQADGGDIELVSTQPDGLVQIRLLGACIGCPSANQTLHHGIERTLRGELGPTVRVEAVASGS
jgi:Fe-S cluster biogenesis protein NfuA